MAKYLTAYRSCLKDHFITVDPGARADGGTGMAFWKNDKKPIPIITKQLDSDASAHQAKVDEILFTFEGVLTGYMWSHNIIAMKDLVVAIEKPQFFDSLKGHTAAKSDALFKLINLYSRMEQIVKAKGVHFMAIEINHWKGQLSKAKVSSRVEQICGKKYSGDVTDAVGIGLFLKGLF